MLRLPAFTPDNNASHSVDDRVYWIDRLDKAWRTADVVAQITALGPAGDTHPVQVYYSASTRYSLGAKLAVPEAIRGDGPATVTIEHYMNPDVAPTRFEIRQLGARDYALADKAQAKVGYLEFARRGLVRVHDAAGPDGRPTTIDPPRANDGGIADVWLDMVSMGNCDLIDNIGFAVYKLCQNGSAIAEGKL